jgi:hypothetical protein
MLGRTLRSPQIFEEGIMIYVLQLLALVVSAVAVLFLVTYLLRDDGSDCPEYWHNYWKNDR